MLLPGDEEVIDRGDGTLVIRIPGETRGRNSTTTASTTDVSEARIRISPTPAEPRSPANKTSPSDSTPPTVSRSSSEVQSRLAMGRAFKKREDYPRAIAAFRMALNGAGEEAAVVYQEIAHCFDRRGDGNSAITNYRKAIDEYRKWIEAGRRADEAREGIRFCESGIKACSE